MRKVYGVCSTLMLIAVFATLMSAQQSAGRAEHQGSQKSASLVNTNLCLLASTMRNRNVQTIQIRNEQGCAGACRSGHVSDAREAKRAVLLKHVDVSCAAADVQPFPHGVVEEIVGVTDDLE